MPGPHSKVGWLAIMLTSTGCAGEPTPAQPAAAPAILVEAPTPTAAPPPALPWPAGPDCRATLAAVAALPSTARGRLEPTAAPLAVTVLDGGAVLPADAALAALQWDLPVATDGRDDAPCLVLVDRTATARAAARQLLAHNVVRSTYRRGSRSIANPEHAELRRSLRELDDEDGVEVLATGDPGLDLIGLLAGGVLDGIDRFQRGSAEKQTRAALAATPASLEQVVWEPYTYEVTTVEAARSGILRAALVDRRLGLAWPVERPMRETHRFGVAAGQNVKDRQLLENPGGDLVVAADVTVWEHAGLQPSLTGLVGLLAAAPGDGVALDAPGLATAWATTPLRLAEAPSGTADAGPDMSTATLDPARIMRSRRTSSVEQLVTADGVRRYRLVTPAAP